MKELPIVIYTNIIDSLKSFGEGKTIDDFVEFRIADQNEQKQYICTNPKDGNLKWIEIPFS